ncbi:hypothetical protein COCSUDRAFT_66937 [Coccomyxa subellipsoidea C-169]|uniref:PI31 proteasome regulator N-terminal domain-containing protein n=1 Tax=Coccomyxa subellipsoidea (strain C-169) TaxID=574566 RepID=I0YT18_COCSC|nr:hypothetical protein COCSUDRAFT_66937 [Coccomyxa subellipsoidea C-169]EIE21537.1 hypothetical protein COCSUDRAFT_66937 [Coccomyxa subellipsoidea C-169]|eukprot:XP_005646081.1 hypothetical protein COCSUDRAFT_66937 [Coccomyxa subellipsoidea C-169]
MATPQVILAIVRAARPKFRSKHDRLAYAVHAFLLADGYKLVATGKDADVPSAEIAQESPEVGMEGWTDLPDAYAFRYVDTTGKRTPILLKMVPMGDKMLLHWASPGSFDEPRMLELNVDDYVDDTARPDDVASAYKNLGDLASRLQSTFYVGSAKDAAAPPAEASSTATQAGSEASPVATPVSAAAARSVEDDPFQLKGPPTYPQPAPYVPRVGTDDLLPPVRPPMPGQMPPGEGGGPLPGGLPGRRGGGMHVGPGDPLFRGPPAGVYPGADPAGSFPGGPGYGSEPGFPPGGLPPGAHWDPIMPPGMQGFRPGDFQRRDRGRFGGGGPDVHPDIMPPGPGRGFDPDVI